MIVKLPSVMDQGPYQHSLLRATHGVETGFRVLPVAPVILGLFNHSLLSSRSMVRIHQEALSGNEVLTSIFSICSKEWLGFVSTAVARFTLFLGRLFLAFVESNCREMAGIRYA